MTARRAIVPLYRSDTLPGYARRRPDRPRPRERRRDGLGGVVGPRTRLPPLGDRAGLGPPFAVGACAGRARRAGAPRLDRARGGVVVLQLRGDRDREVA